MSMKPPMWEGGRPVTNAVTQPRMIEHYAQVTNAVTSTKPTGNPEPTNTGHGTTTTGPIPGARGPVGSERRRR
jgi:hypothetical protein